MTHVFLVFYLFKSKTLSWILLNNFCIWWCEHMIVPVNKHDELHFWKIFLNVKLSLYLWINLIYWTLLVNIYMISLYTFLIFSFSEFVARLHLSYKLSLECFPSFYNFYNVLYNVWLIFTLKVCSNTSLHISSHIFLVSIGLFSSIINTCTLNEIHLANYFHSL